MATKYWRPHPVRDRFYEGLFCLMLPWVALWLWWEFRKARRSYQGAVDRDHLEKVYQWNDSERPVGKRGELEWLEVEER